VNAATAVFAAESLSRNRPISNPRFLPRKRMAINFRFSRPRNAIFGINAANAYPHHLSGGMAQRVALARALINHPKVLLLDEPLGALGAFTRMRMQDEVLRLWENRRTTMLLVTHDIDEAIYMSHRILIMTQAPGRIDREIDIDLARPRDRTSDSFLRFRSEILEHLHFAGKTAA